MTARLLVAALLSGAASAATTRCNADNCARAVSGTYLGKPTQTARFADCSSFFKCTAYPATVTSTTTTTVFPSTTTTTVFPFTETDPFTFSTLTTTVDTSTDYFTAVVPVTIGETVTDFFTVTSVGGSNLRRAVSSAPAFTTVCPSSVPKYASLCSGTARFSSACSCAGVTKSYSTVSSTPSTTVTVTQTGVATSTVTATFTVTTSILATQDVTALTSVTTIVQPTVFSTTTVDVTSTIVVSPPNPSGNAYCENGQAVNGLSPACNAVGCSTTNLRIEGRTGTIYEGVILAGPRNITTPSGGTHLCDGTNNNANPVPFNNGISTIDAAAQLCGFGYDGTFSNQFDDFFIQTIGDTPSTGNQFWGILNNYAFTPAGGCETEVLPTDELLWAFNAFNVNFFLRVQPTQTPVVLAPGQAYTFSVQGSDGESGSFQPISGASFAGLTSDGNGNVAFTAPITPGTYRYKATRGDSIRSNAVTVVVQG